ncbi:HGGxSTG domain-containing protein [Bradyrhizobium guangxiense]|uniref:HGGxSTG domain-containing protein n=1 Tax=Bradyrhizobium guangxiense TaxID=1325115 RepID=UPI00100900DE|nr:HGGxSTG domain-containing protein [Bradyrhizobium guangxiense]
MSAGHIRNTSAMSASLRCGARTRSGTPCCAPAMHGKARCRMHGGAPRSGAPKGNQNARRHGMFTQDGIAERQQVRSLLEDAWKLLNELE